MTSVREQYSADTLDAHRAPPTPLPLSEGEQLNSRRRNALAAIDGAPFSRFHVKICLVTGVGFLTDAYDVFTIIIVTSMLGIVYGEGQTEPTQLHPWQNAGLKLATSVGNLIGQLVFGWLADIFGRKRMYGIELAIMIVATFGQAVSGQGPKLNIVYTLIVWRVILGIGVGGDYPLSAVITSEFASTRIRGRLMTAVFAFQGLGQLIASLVSLVVVAAFKHSIQNSPNYDAVDFTWRLLIGLGCIPATIALYFRLTIPETPRFTIDIERRVGQADRDARNAVQNSRYTIYDDGDSVVEARVAAPRASTADFISYFSQWSNFKILLGAAYSWFVLDIIFYILTLDNTDILTSIRFGTVDNDVYQTLLNLCVGNVILIVGGYLPGFVAAFAVIDIWGRRPMQFAGFAILTVLFLIMSFTYDQLHGQKEFMVLYCLANFFQNFGPNTTTFIIPGEAFPTRYRTTAYGIAAASGKLGAVIAQVLYAGIGVQNSPNKLKTLLEVLSFIMMTGILSTLLLPETNQRTLEDLSNEEQETYIMGPRKTAKVLPSDSSQHKG